VSGRSSKEGRGSLGKVKGRGPRPGKKVTYVEKAGGGGVGGGGVASLRMQKGKLGAMLDG